MSVEEPAFSWRLPLIRNVPPLGASVPKTDVMLEMTVVALIVRVPLPVKVPDVPTVTPIDDPNALVTITFRLSNALVEWRSRTPGIRHPTAD
jgi:hypothetical protein